MTSRFSRGPASFMLVALFLVACTAETTPARSPGPAANSPAQSSAPKRLTTAILGDLNTFSYLINVGIGSIRGVDEAKKLVHAGLSIVDGKTGNMAPILAEQVPTLENGLWKVFPDGRMETTWRIKENARWHDGTPVSTDDLLFTATTGQDPELPALGGPGYKAVDSLEALDKRTIVVRWKQPYTEADRLFSSEFGMPLPRHLLEATYTEDRTNFTQNPYFSERFIGAGPFRLKEFVRGSHAALSANDDYVLGRPKLDEIVVKFISDPNTVGMSDALQEGFASVAHTPLVPSEPEYAEVASSIVRFDYDPRRAGQIIEGLGYTRAADGFFRDENGQRLTIEARTNAGDDLKDKLLFTSADDWQRAGIGVDTFIVPRQAATDREFRSTYPGFDLVRQPFEPLRYHSSEAPLPTNRWAGANRGRYMNPELDALIDPYYVTIARPERMRILGQIIHHMSDRAVILGTLYGQEPILIGNRLVNVTAAQPQRAVDSWNAHEWDIRS